MESTTDRGRHAGPPAIRFGTSEPPEVSETFEFVPRDVLVFWEDDRADHYKRVVGLVVDDKLKLVRITVGRENRMEVICEAPIAEGEARSRPWFVTRDALLFWAESRARHGFGKTIVLRVGATLKMLRVTAEDRKPTIEILETVDVGA